MPDSFSIAEDVPAQKGGTPGDSRQRTMGHATLLSELKQHVRQFLTARLDAVIKKCMAPGMHVDLKQDDLHLRYAAMDALFAAREPLSEACLTQALMGLEMRSRDNLIRTMQSAKTRKVTLEDADMAMVAWNSFREVHTTHAETLANIDYWIRMLAVALNKPLDSDCLQIHRLYESYRRQVRNLNLSLAGKRVLCQMFAMELASNPGTLYEKASATLSALGEPNNEALVAYDHELHEASDESALQLYSAVKTVAALFEEIDRTPNYSDDARRLLLSIRPFMVRLAMDEGKAFEDEGHPARQLVSNLAQRWRGIMDNTDERHRTLSASVEKLTAVDDKGEPTCLDRLRMM